MNRTYFVSESAETQRLIQENETKLRELQKVGRKQFGCEADK
jgi:hypothetical protein